MNNHQESAFNTMKKKLSKSTTEIQNTKNNNCLLFLNEFIEISKTLDHCIDFNHRQFAIFSNDTFLLMNMDDNGLVNIVKESTYDHLKSVYLHRKVIDTENLNDVLKEYKKEAKKNQMSSIYK
jgi:hypothetical protein